MNDMLMTIVPKSTQLNADDLIGGVAKIIKITSVKITPGSEQPVAIHYEGDNGKPYMACKSMRRVLVNVWGADANKYVGRSLELIRDDSVKFGGMEVGGIRISRISDISRPVTMALTASKAVRRPFTVQPLPVGAEPKKQTLTEWLAALKSELENGDAEGVAATLERQDVKRARASKDMAADRKKELDFMIASALDRTKPLGDATEEEPSVSFGEEEHI